MGPREFPWRDWVAQLDPDRGRRVRTLDRMLAISTSLVGLELIHALVLGEPARIWIALGAGTAFVSAYALLRVQRWPNAAAHVYLLAIPVFLWLAMRSSDVPILAVGYLSVPLIATAVLGPRAGLAWMAAMLIVIGQNALASYTSWVLMLVLAGLGASVAILERERLRHVALLQSTHAELADERERFAALAERSFELIAEADGQGNLIFANRALLSLLDYQPQDVEHLSVVGLLHPEDRGRAREALAAVTAGGRMSLQTRLLHRDGHAIWVEVHGAPYVTRSREERWIIAARAFPADATLADEARSEIFDAPTGTERIWVVEDHPGVRQMLVEALSGSGYRVAAFAAAAEALAQVGDGLPDLLVTDVVMPGIRGPELAKALRSERPDLPVLFISGYSDERPEELRSASSDFIRKPQGPQEIRRRVRSLLDCTRG